MIYPNVLEIDLGSETSEFYEDNELFDKYLGGIGVAIELFKRNIKTGIDPLSSDNVVVFAIGPLNSYYPVASKTSAVFKSPLTGNLGESYAGGRLSTAMRFGNIGAIVVKGKAEQPSYFVHRDGETEICNAGPIRFMYPNTAGRIIRENVGYPGRRSVITIGPAGERMVPYAGATVDRFRHFGRLGLGAVLGSKNLKGLVVIGDQPISLEINTDYQKYRKVFTEIYKKTTETELMSKYHVLGTPAGILPLNVLKSLPTRNFRESTFTFAENISGEYFAEELLARRVACGGCPLGCIHLGILRERYSSESVGDIHTIVVSYDYELIYALGSNLLIKDASDVLRLIEAVEREGMDVISTGVVLGWLAEAYERNLISPEDTKGQIIRFGHVEDFLKIIPKISAANPEEELFFLASKGVDALVERYGGREYAISIAKVEPAGYSTGPYSIMGQVIGGRHSHLDNAGYSLDQKTLTNPVSSKDGLMKLMVEEEWRNVLNSFVVCLFARGVYDVDTSLKALEALKINRTADDLEQFGKEIQKKRLGYKNQEGFNLAEVRKKLPERFFEMMTAHGIIMKKSIDELFEEYEEIAKGRYNFT